MLRVTSQFAPRSNIGQFAKVVISPLCAEATQASCELVQGIAKGYCPVDTGALRDSIVVSEAVEGDATITQSVAPGMFYASYVEYGTGRRGDPSAPYPHVMSWPGMHAQPYMRPALDEARGQVKDIFLQKLGAAFD
jgi:HK97 gp10 family phage protein